LQRLDNIIKI